MLSAVRVREAAESGIASSRAVAESMNAESVSAAELWPPGPQEAAASNSTPPAANFVKFIISNIWFNNQTEIDKD
jgi:hypothetical protein